MDRYLNYIFLLVFLALPFSNGLWAQKTKKPREARVKGTETIPVEKNMTMEQAEQLCIDMAKVAAIEAEFGRVIFQGNSTYIENVNTGKKVESDVRLVSIGNSFVNAEIIRMDEPQCEFLQDDKGQFWVKCNVKGHAREILQPPIEFIATPLDCPEPRCKELDFYTDQRFYMHFKTPVDGYLSIYLADGDHAYCLLPCNGISGSTFQVNADEDYILFTEQEFLLYTEKEFESDRLFLIFSENDYNKDIIEKGESFTVDGEEFIMPDNLKVESFQQWLSKLRSKRTDIQVKMVDVTIKS